MSNKTLYKLFYSDHEEHQAEFERRFNADATIHLNIKIGDHPAFICETPEILKRIISIERINNKVNRLCEELPTIALEQFRVRCLIDEIVITNNIEGVHSTRKEISEILHDLSKNNKHKRFVGLVNKYALLMSSGKISVRTAEDVRKIYDDIFYEEINASDPSDLPDGKLFRKGDVGVYSETGKKIHEGLQPESKIISAMNEALNFLNNSSHEHLIRIAAFHYLFGYIHPFYDGNGRTSRFISSYSLSSVLNYLIGYRISFTIKENIKKYYDAFKICNHHNNKGELTPFVEMFLEIIDISMKQLFEALESRFEKLFHYRELIKRFPFSEDDSMIQLYDILIQAALFSNNGIYHKELEYTMELSYNTIHKRLEKIPYELLVINKQRNKPFYMLNLKTVDEMYT